MKLSFLIAQSTAKTPRLDAEILLSHVLKKPREYVLIHPETKLTTKQIDAYQKLIIRRQKDEPIAYLIGHKFFYGLKFKVNRHTLIPRPETELMVEQALSLISDLKLQTENLSVVDLGTGSGAIIISLAKKLSFQATPTKNTNLNSTTDKKKDKKNCHFFATDISENALKIAQENARKNKTAEIITFLQSDLLNHQKIQQLFQQKQLIVILANLPYLSQEIYSSADISVRNFEPTTALISGQDGLNHYRRLFAQLSILQSENHKLQTILFCEISPEQKPLIAKEIKFFFSEAKIKFFKDLAGKWRLVQISLDYF